MLAFGPGSEPVSEPPVGYSAAPEDVRQRVTKEDLGWIRTRREALASRSIQSEVAEMDALIAELTG